MAEKETGKSDRGFGAMAVRLKFIGEAQLTETLDVQQKMHAMGVDEPLGDIFVKKGYLTDDQRRAVLKALGVTNSSIPGYKIMSKIASGGMGTVYKALQESMNRTVAVKVLSSLYTKDASYVARFLREARAAAALDHKNIIHAIDVGNVGETYFFIMEYVDGRTAREIFDKEKPLAESRVIDIAIQVAEALDYVHQHKMVHRDIKPENLMITADGIVKVCDFGLARGMEREQSLTMDGYVVGTPYYMSPDHIQTPDKLDVRADLYSLGATAYVLASGQLVFLGKTHQDTLDKHLHQAPIDPRKHNPKLSEHFTLVLLKLLEKDRTNRYQTPRELIDDLKHIQSGTAPTHARPGHTTRTKRVLHDTVHRHAVPTRPSSSLGLVFGVAALLIVGLIVIFAVSGSDKKTDGPVAGTTARPPPPTATTSVVPPAAADDPKKLKEAAELWALAETDVKSSRWSDALARLDKLQSAYANLAFVREKTVALGTMTAQCKTGLADSARDTEKQYREAMAVLDASGEDPAQVARARKILESLQPAAGVTADALQRALEDCERERAAEEVLKAIQSHLKATLWKKAVEQIAVATSRFSGTRRVRAMRHFIDGCEAAAKDEIVAEETYAQLKIAVNRSAWGDAVPLLELLELAGKTSTYRANEPDIALLRQQVAKADRGQMEKRALTAWKDMQEDFERLMKANNWQEASAKLDGFRASHKDSTAYESNREAMKSMQKRIDDLRAKRREEDAADCLKRAKEAAQKKRYEDAAKLLEQLAAEYSGTKASKDASVKKLREECEREAAKLSNVLWRCDFEDPNRTWSPDFDTDAGPTFGTLEDATEGKRAGSFTFPCSRGGNWSFISTPLDTLDARAESISFWVKATRKNSGGTGVMRCMLIEDEDVSEEFSADFAVTNDWKRIAIDISKFDRQWGRPGTNSRLDRDKVKKLAFFHWDRTQAIDFVVDLITLEKK